MARGFRMGGAGASVAPQPVDDKFWIVKDGVVQIPFDATVYKASSVYNVGGQWSYSAANYLYRSILAVNTACVGYAATNALDVTNYSQMRVIGRALQTNAWQDKTYSLASVSGSYYFVLDVLRSSGGVTGLNVYLTNAKDNYSTNRVWTQQVDSTSNTTTSNYSQIKDIYLEKKENLLPPLDSLALTQPSNTASAATTRTFTKNSLVKGISASNYYYPNYVTSYSISGNTVSETVSTRGYGIGCVLDNIAEGKTYQLSWSVLSGSNVVAQAAYWDASGNYIGFVSLSGDNTFTVPSGAKYTIINVTTNSTSNLSFSYTLNSIIEVTN